jgi:hypothetical protein
MDNQHESACDRADFFRMKNGHDDEGLATLFTDNAIVVDGGENLTIRGANARAPSLFFGRPDTAENRPDHRELGRFQCRKAAMAFLATG